MSDIRPAFDTTVDPAVTSFASLASSATLVAGASCAQWTFAAKPIDALLNMKIKTGSSPTVSKWFEIWPVAKQVFNAGNSWPDAQSGTPFDGTDRAITVTSRNVLFGLSPRGRGPILQQFVDATSNQIYYPTNLSLADYFYGNVPTEGIIFITQNTGVALNASGHAVSITPKYIQSM